MKHFIMLIGIPASGKSTFIKKYTDKDEYVVISSDDIIEKIAKETNKTYSEVFNSSINEANKAMLEQARKAIEAGKDIIWDQTNLSIKSRKNKLAMVPKDYIKTAIVFPVPPKDELKRRLDSRPGKTIPMHIVDSMIYNFQNPIISEGFDTIFPSTEYINALRG